MNLGKLLEQLNTELNEYKPRGTKPWKASYIRPHEKRPSHLVDQDFVKKLERSGALPGELVKRGKEVEREASFVKIQIGDQTVNVKYDEIERWTEEAKKANKPVKSYIKSKVLEKTRK